MRILALVAVGCGGGLPPCESDEFVAMQSDFADYESWHRFEIDSPDPRLGDEPRTVYVNALPPRGSEVFPRCTMLVKVAEDGPDPADVLLVGMAKRDGGYNPDGAVGWEWFDLQPGADGTPIIDWRGPVPPDGEGYGHRLGDDDEPGAEEIGDCNVCHAAAADNDFVLTPALDLSER